MEKREWWPDRSPSLLGFVGFWWTGMGTGVGQDSAAGTFPVTAFGDGVAGGSRNQKAGLECSGVSAGKSNGGYNRVAVFRISFFYFGHVLFKSF
ncbi:MAG: hypothetical protein LBS59_04525 [Puniceicoccales bacterium]|nr:hypothetical protein [Puniceicoccales bacterium]